MASLLARILTREERALTATEAIRRLIQSTTTRSGVAVNEQSALQTMAVFTAVRILSETFAQVPLKIYRLAADGSRSEARSHPLWKILHDQPNDEMTSFTLREVMLGHLLTWGNAYLEISRNFNGDLIGLWPLLPNRTRPARNQAGELVYITRIQRDPANIQHLEEVRLPARNVLHIPGLGFDGLMGYSVISMARESIGLSMAYEAFGSYFFGNNAIPGFVLSTDKELKMETVKDLEHRIKEQHEGLTNAQRLMILTGGLKPERIGISPEDSQFIDSRKFSRSEILGLYRIPPHMAGDTEKSSSWGTGIEQMSIGFVTYTMMPWFKRVEQSLNMKLFGANAQAPIYPEFEVDGLMRGDFKTRQDAYAVGRQWGWLSVNDIKRRENDPVIGPKGDIYLTPLNMQPAEDALLEPPVAPRGMPGTGVDVGVEAGGTPPTTDKSAASTASFRRALAEGQSHALIDLVERALRREKADVVRGVDKTVKAGADLPGWLGAFYADHRKWFLAQATPALTALGESVRADVARELDRAIPRAGVMRFVHAFVDGMAERIVSESEGLMRAALVARPEAQQVAAVVDRRAESIGRHEALRAVNAIASACYREAGTLVAWVAQDMCAVCAELDGRTVVAGEPFLTRGEKQNERDISHPPACEECSCVIVARGAPTQEEIVYIKDQTPRPPNVVVNNIAPAAAPVVTFEKDSITVRAEAPVVNIPPTVVTIEKGAVQVDIHQPISVAAAPTPNVNVTTPSVNVTSPPLLRP